MRRMAWALLLLFAFTIPWEYSLDLGPPWGNAARIAGLLLLLAAVPAILQSARMRRPGVLQWLVLALYLWFCCSYFWTIDQAATLGKMRAYFQQMMAVWLVWEFAASPRHLRALLRAFVAGCWVLALLTLVDFTSPAAVASGQFRFAAYGQDPNDVARFLDLGFPLAMLLAMAAPESRWPERVLAWGYLPLGLLAVMLTASRGGFVAGMVALAGCGILLARGRSRAFLAFALPAAAAGLWLALPREIFTRLATIPEQLSSFNLNQRWNIWSAGWRAFTRAPLFGSGAGTFVNAAGLAPMDTAHNTALSIAVGGGLCALFLAIAIVVVVTRMTLRTHGTLRLALAISLLAWAVTSLASTVEESRTTWLFFGLIALAGRLADEEPEALAACFPDSKPASSFAAMPSPSATGA